jgi:hypothetical protein
MIHLFSFITHAKSSKIVLLREPEHSKPFGLLLKGFFYSKFIIEKKDYFHKHDKITKRIFTSKNFKKEIGLSIIITSGNFVEVICKIRIQVWI